MKANELMIGDWVYDKMLKGYGKIEVLTPYAIQCDIHTGTHNMDFFEPIPLTEEIFEANGLGSKSSSGLSMLKWGISLRSGNNYVGMSFEYVHQLQHAYRLLGEPELADNFRIE